MAPAAVETFGERFPVYAAFSRQSLTSPNIVNEADIASMVKHDLRHFEDWHEGIKLGDVYMAYSTMQGKLGIKFLEQLMELRATYVVLEEILKEIAITGKSRTSMRWTGSQGYYYADNWEFVKYNAETDLERRVSQLQLQKSQTIVPSRTGDAIVLTFNLFGREDKLVLIPVQ